MTIRIALTTGEPAGIGPDICVVVAQRPPVNTELVIIGDQSMLEQRARDLKLPLSLHPFSDSEPSPSSPGKLSILQVGVAQEVVTVVKMVKMVKADARPRLPRESFYSSMHRPVFML